MFKRTNKKGFQRFTKIDVFFTFAAPINCARVVTEFSVTGMAQLKGVARQNVSFGAMLSRSMKNGHFKGPDLQ